ncbi:MAG: endonuclease/exonuclease/phosphatase family protein [Patescibacteria group bacterium]
MKLKILSWNIWCYGKFEEISEFLKNFDANIIGLQEVLPDDPKMDIIGFMKKLGYHSSSSNVPEIRKDGINMSNAIFSKYPILSHKTHILSEEDSRNALQADIKIGDKILHVFNTHLLHTHQRPSQTQDIQVENLIKVLPKENTIMMGDFNATPESSVIKKMREVFTDTDPASEPTWSVYPEGCSGCNPHKVFIRLDYIFTSRDIKANSPKVHQSKGSDHLPISAVVDI